MQMTGLKTKLENALKTAESRISDDVKSEL